MLSYNIEISILLLPHITVLMLPCMVKCSDSCKRPFGPRMCVHLCGQLERCVYPLYDQDDLKCYLSEANRGHIQENDLWKLAMNNDRIDNFVNLTCPIEQRKITARRGVQLVVVQGIKKRSQVWSAMYFRTINGTKKQPQETFSLRVPSSLRYARCRVLSMAISRIHPGILYLLLDCSLIFNCYRKLHFVDLKSKTLLNIAVEFCEKVEGRRQISTGPCFKNKLNDCLYSINVDTKIFITTYEEPATLGTRLITEVTKQISSYSTELLSCSINKGDLLCIRGTHLYRIDLNTSNILFKTKNLGWHFQRFPEIQDFIIADIGHAPIAVVLQKSLVTLLAIDFERRTFIKLSAVETKARVVSIIKADIILHSGDLDKPFIICHVHTLQRCIMP